LTTKGLGRIRLSAAAVAGHFGFGVIRKFVAGVMPLYLLGRRTVKRSVLNLK
jgi:hypothetical protein